MTTLGTNSKFKRAAASQNLEKKDSLGLFPSAGPPDEVFSRKRPLATRMRPRNLEEFVGQASVVGPETLLHRQIGADRVQSLILFGPPGTGKTTLAQIIASRTNSHFVGVNAVSINIEELRNLLTGANNRFNNTGVTTVIFLDEIHRLNGPQQDRLLQDIESGVVVLVGATTENPNYCLNSALLSRSLVVQFSPLTEEDLLGLMRRALKDSERGLGYLKISADEMALRHLAIMSDGDARKTLNALEVAAVTTAPDASGVIHITLSVAEQSIQRKTLVYGDNGKYETVSAYQKAMRGGDPDASLYWLAKMLKAGETPDYIARRLVVCAAEDIGLADPLALMLANAVLQAVNTIGWPESKLPLSMATIYLATTCKSNSATKAIEAAEDDVESGRTIPVPRHLHDRHNRGVTKPGESFDYKLPHDHPGHFIAQDYLGVDRTFYHPTQQGAEKQIKLKVEEWRKQFQELRRVAPSPVDEVNKSVQKCSACQHGHSRQSDEILCVNSTMLEMNPGKMLVFTAASSCEHFAAKSAVPA